MCIICDPSRKEEMEAAAVLVCEGCLFVTAIPLLPMLRHLYCKACPSLSTIPALPNLVSLDCTGCPLLEAIPELPKLDNLFCGDCPLLATLPGLPRLVDLFCEKCPSLASIPALPKLTYMECDPWIDHPLNHYLPAFQKAARTLARRRVKKLRYVRFKKFISTPAYSAYLNSPGHIGHRIETAQLRKLGSERT